MMGYAIRDDGRGWRSVNGPDDVMTGEQYSADEPPLTLPIDVTRAEAIAAVVTAAAAARDAWRTPGKDGVYLSKLATADAWEAAGQPADLTDYPYLNAEVGITRDSAADLVTLWRDMDKAWASASAQIERSEMTAKAAVNAAKDASVIQDVIAGLEWPAS